MILVTGAAGKTGLAVIGALASRGQEVRALVRRDAQLDVVRQAGAGGALVGNFLDENSLRPAFEGVTAVYHIPPNVHPDEVAIAERVISAAQAAGVTHLVYHSVLHPQIEAMPHHWHKLRVEERIFESGLPFTILQPGAYMQNVFAGWKAITEENAYRVPYSLEARLSLVDLQDVAAVAALVLTDPIHKAATYELAGPQALSQIEIAQMLSHALGQTVRAEKMNISVWKNAAQQSGLGTYQIETLIKMFHYYDQHGLIGNATVLAHLLDRTPTSFPQFLHRRLGLIS